jgi:hypothetical protein
VLKARKVSRSRGHCISSSASSCRTAHSCLNPYSGVENSTAGSPVTGAYDELQLHQSSPPRTV